ncbi:MAG: hypothetical protein ACM33V_02120 [Chloroflexota bacterium]|nr:hypothetical protein [Anaerolineales bacterium]
MKVVARSYLLLFLLSSLILFSCSPGASPSTPQLATVYSTAAAQTWLAPLYDCAGSSVALSRVDSAASADIVLRLGEPEFLDAPAYQIGQEEIWIVTHHESPIPQMSLEQIQALFAGLGDPSIQVWGYASEDDVQQVFDRFLMNGRSVGSSMHVATDPQQIVDVLESERQAVGILPVTWSMKMSGSRGLYQVATVPVLAITNSEPQDLIRELIACLQK